MEGMNLITKKNLWLSSVTVIWVPCNMDSSSIFSLSALADRNSAFTLLLNSPVFSYNCHSSCETIHPGNRRLSEPFQRGDSVSSGKLHTWQRQNVVGLFEHSEMFKGWWILHCCMKGSVTAHYAHTVCQICHSRVPCRCPAIHTISHLGGSAPTHCTR